MMALSNTNITNLIDENIRSDIVKYDLLNEITTTANITPSKYSNFYSQPSIADPLSALQYMPTAIVRQLPSLPPQQTSLASYFNRFTTPPPTLTTTNRLLSDDYLLSKPIFSKNYNQLNSSYINDDYYNTQPFKTHSHYASNPCLSSHSYLHNQHPLSSSSFNRSNYYQSHHQPMFSSRPPSISSLNRYATLSNNYASSFNAQPYYRTGSRLDLDNPKSNEIKRQVSFKFDVDQMSFDP